MPLEWREINSRQIGRNPLPSAVLFHDRDQALSYISKRYAYSGECGHPRSDSDAGFAYCYSELVGAVNNDFLFLMDSPLRLIL